jgi:hypothetical protein
VIRIVTGQNHDTVMVGHVTNTKLNRPSSSDLEIALKLEPIPLLICFNAVYQAVDPNRILYRHRYFPDAVLKSCRGGKLVKAAVSHTQQSRS